MGHFYKWAGICVVTFHCIELHRKIWKDRGGHVIQRFTPRLALEQLSRIDSNHKGRLETLCSPDWIMATLTHCLL